MWGKRAGLKIGGGDKDGSKIYRGGGSKIGKSRL